MGERLENYAWSMIDGCIKNKQKETAPSGYLLQLSITKN
jgi:hypothetical protein